MSYEVSAMFADSSAGTAVDADRTAVACVSNSPTSRQRGGKPTSTARLPTILLGRGEPSSGRGGFADPLYYQGCSTELVDSLNSAVEKPFGQSEVTTGGRRDSRT